MQTVTSIVSHQRMKDLMFGMECVDDFDLGVAVSAVYRCSAVWSGLKCSYAYSPKWL